MDRTSELGLMDIWSSRRRSDNWAGWIQLLQMRVVSVVREWQAIPRNSKFWRNFWKICLWLERKLQMWGKTFDAFFFDHNENRGVCSLHHSYFSPTNIDRESFGSPSHILVFSALLISNSSFRWVSFTIFFFCFRRRWFPIAALSVFPPAHNHEITKACSFKLTTTYKCFSNWGIQS